MRVVTLEVEAVNMGLHLLGRQREAPSLSLQLKSAVNHTMLTFKSLL